MNEEKLKELYKEMAEVSKKYNLPTYPNKKKSKKKRNVYLEKR